MRRLTLGEIELPAYTEKEERLNALTHAPGIALALGVLARGLTLAARHGRELAAAGCGIFALSMLAVYAVSTVYHGLPRGDAKKGMRVVDHCTIYLLIAGTYTPVLLTAIRPERPGLAWALFAGEWGLALLAGLLTAVNMKRYSGISMACYITMGWLIVLALRETVEAVTMAGFLWLLAGGVAYTVGAALYGVGKKKRYFHAVFHVFVLLGSVLQAVCILRYVL